MNDIQIIGNLTRDAIIRVTKSNIKVAKLKVAVNSKKNNQDSNNTLPPEFFTINCWDKLANLVEKYDLKKGDCIYVKGRIKTNAFELADGTMYRDKEIKALVITPM